MLDWRTYIDSLAQQAYTESLPDFHIQLALKSADGKTGDAETTLQHAIDSRDTKYILISGRPGSGKSFLISSLANLLAERLRAELNAHEQAIFLDQVVTDDSLLGAREQSGVFRPTSSSQIPILIRLNKLNIAEIPVRRGASKLQRHVESELRLAGLRMGIRRLLNQGPRFVLLIDDLDEVAASNWIENLREVRRFIAKIAFYPQVTVVFAGRPKAIDYLLDLHSSVHFTVENLDDDDVRVLLDRYLFKEETDQLIEFLHIPEGLLKFIASPLFVREAAIFWRNQPDYHQNLGELLKHLFDSFIYRQQKTEVQEHIGAVLRRRTLNLERTAFATLNSNGVLSQGQIKEIGDSDLEWYQLMGFLSDNPSEIRFTNKWVQAYFAASHLQRHDYFPSRAARLDALEQLMSISPVLRACVLLLQNLTTEDYSVYLENLSVRFQVLSADEEIGLLTWVFEQKVAEYIQREHHFDRVETSYRRPYLKDGEIDIYAEKFQNHKRHVWVVKCKLRFAHDPRDVEPSYLEQLYHYKQVVSDKLQADAADEGHTYELSAILATNGRKCSEDMEQLAKSYGLEIWDFDFPASKLWSRNNKLSSQLRRRIR